ncbi:hypothetical protein [Pseudomonas fulva]|uniref:hypothetical protein n=1 Tax=Pseudomonas fulva TaxID=47880 RepID=UPI003461A6FF
MIYSRVLQVEHEQPKNEYGQGAYTVFNVIQPYELDFQKAQKVQIQTLAVLWNDHVDTRVIAMIEDGLIGGVLPPVILLHSTHSVLNIVYSSQINPDAQAQFEQAWNKISENSWSDEWTTYFIRDSEAHSTYEGGRAFSAYANDILINHDLGVRKFTSKMFLHYEECKSKYGFSYEPEDRSSGESAA